MNAPTAGLAYTVIMPAYNEAEHLAENIRETLAVMDALGGEYEIIVVDDCSRDQTATVLADVQQRHPRVRPLALACNQGKGQALREGFFQAQGELIFFLDADLELHPRQFNLFLDMLKRQNVDVVIGSKRHPQSVLDYPWRRRLMSTIYFLMVKLLFGLPLRDTQTGLKLFKREVLSRAFPKMLVKQFAFDLELLVLAHYHGFRIAEAPVEVHYKAKLGHIRPRDVFDIWWDTMAVWYRLYIVRYYDKVKT